MIKQAEKQDLDALVNLAAQLWEDAAPEELREEFSSLLCREDAAFFLQMEAGKMVGFAQCQLRRDYVEGTGTSPVGYLEGIFVRAECRGRGYARALLSACEDWARGKGCREFASDCELSNTVSLRFHQALGFAEANRIICFTKKL